jgi:hypothetical protein
MARLDDVIARYDPLPGESAVVLGLAAHFGFAEFNKRADARTPFWGLEFDSKWDTESFVYIGSPHLGGGDTQWWMYLMVKAA